MEINQVMCILRAPLFTGHEEKLYSVVTFPMKQNNHYVQILQPRFFVSDMAIEDLYFPDECHGPVPKACHPGVKYDKRQQPRSHGLITQDREQLTQCLGTLFTKRPLPEEIMAATINRYIVETKNATYHYRCPHSSPNGEVHRGGNLGVC